MISVSGYLGSTMRRKHWTLSVRVREGFMEEVTIKRGSWKMARRAFQPVQGGKEKGFFFLSEEESSCLTRF